MSTNNYTGLHVCATLLFMPFNALGFSPTVSRLVHADAATRGSSGLPIDLSEERMGHILASIHVQDDLVKMALRATSAVDRNIQAFVPAILSSFQERMGNADATISPLEFSAAVNAYLLGQDAQAAGDDDALKQALLKRDMPKVASLLRHEGDGSMLAWTATVFSTDVDRLRSSQATSDQLIEAVRRHIGNQAWSRAAESFGALVSHAFMKPQDAPDFPSLMQEFGEAGVPGILPPERVIDVAVPGLDIQVSTTLNFDPNVQSLGLHAMVGQYKRGDPNYYRPNGDLALAVAMDDRHLGAPERPVGFWNSSTERAVVPKSIRFVVIPVDQDGSEGPPLDPMQIPRAGAYRFRPLFSAERALALPGRMILPGNGVFPDDGLVLWNGAYVEGNKARIEGDEVVVGVGAFTVRLDRQTGDVRSPNGSTPVATSDDKR